MKHIIQHEGEINTPFLTKDKATYSAGDELIIETPNHRDQQVVTIASVNRDKVNKGWVYLGLTGIDDLPGSVGGGYHNVTED